MTKCTSLPTSEPPHPLAVQVVLFTIILHFSTIKNLSFPIFLGFPWWNSLKCNINWGKMSVSIQNSGSTLVVALQKTPHEKMSWISSLIVSEHLSLPTLKVSLPPNIHLSLDILNKKAWSELPARHTSDLHIEILPGKTLSWDKVYYNTHVQGLILKEYINDLLAKGFKRRYSSPCFYHILFVKNLDGVYGLLSINHFDSITLKDKYHVPSSKKWSHNLIGPRMLTKMDMKNVYKQVRNTERQGWKTEFWTHFGLYK